MTPADRARMERAAQLIEQLTRERDEARRVAKLLAKYAADYGPPGDETLEAAHKATLAYPEVKS